MILAALLACWRPDPALAPPPPVPLPDLELPGEGEAPEEEADEEEAEAPPAPPPAPPIDPYPAVTLTRPVTLVDDFGKALTTIETVGWPVEVVAEEPIRVKVRCPTCTPAVEGWVQPGRVGRAP